MSPVPRKTTRMSDGGLPPKSSSLSNDQAGRFSLTHRSLLDLPLTERFCATGAQIVVDFSSRKDEKETLTHRHCATAISTVKRGSAEVFELAHLTPHGKVGFLCDEVGFASVRNVGNNGIQHNDRRLGGVDVHDETVAIVVK